MLASGAGAEVTTDTSELAVEAYPQHVAYKAALTEGEHLTYDIKWAGIPSGRAELSVKWVEKVGPEEADCFHVTCATRSNSFSSFFYPVRDDVVSLIDAGGFFSRQFDMDKNEGRYHANENVRFDYARGRAEYVKYSKGQYGTREQTAAVKLWDKVQDPLSCLYYLRNLDLRVGEDVAMTVNTAKRNWLLTVGVLRREKLVVGQFGELDTIKIQPEVSFPGIFVRKGKMTIWIEEKTRVPVRMDVDVPIGSITVVLAEAENSPLNAKPPAAAPAATAAPAQVPAAPAPVAGAGAR